MRVNATNAQCLRNYFKEIFQGNPDTAQTLFLPPCFKPGVQNLRNGQLELYS